jgi:hypothetical protein
MRDEEHKVSVTASLPASMAAELRRLADEQYGGNFSKLMRKVIHEGLAFLHE